MPKTILPAACCEAPRRKANASMASGAAGDFRGSHMSKEIKHKHTSDPWKVKLSVRVIEYESNGERKGEIARFRIPFDAELFSKSLLTTVNRGWFEVREKKKTIALFGNTALARRVA